MLGITGLILAACRRCNCLIYV